MALSKIYLTCKKNPDFLWNDKQILLATLIYKILFLCTAKLLNSQCWKFSWFKKAHEFCVNSLPSIPKTIFLKVIICCQCLKKNYCNLQLNVHHCCLPLPCSPFTRHLCIRWDGSVVLVTLFIEFPLEDKLYTI